MKLSTCLKNQEPTGVNLLFIYAYTYFSLQVKNVEKMLPLQLQSLMLFTLAG